MTHQGKVWWTELNTWDVEAAKAFYGATLGWTFEATPINKTCTAPYWLAKREGDVVCGIFSLRSPDFDGVPSHWLTYLAVDALETSLANVRAGGGSILREPIHVAGVGTFAIIADSTGAAFGMIAPDPSGSK